MQRESRQAQQANSVTGGDRVFFFSLFQTLSEHPKWVRVGRLTVVLIYELLIRLGDFPSLLFQTCRGGAIITVRGPHDDCLAPDPQCFLPAWPPMMLDIVGSFNLLRLSLLAHLMGWCCLPPRDTMGAKLVT